MSTATTSPVDTPLAARTLTSIAVSVAPGRARVLHTSSAEPGAPSIRAVVLKTGPAYARVSLVPEGALLLAGDDVLIRITVGAGACLELVEPAGTVAYDMRGGHARWCIDLELEENARLIWHGEPFVVSAGARVERSLHATISATAVVALREILALGRHDEGAGDLLQHARFERPDGTPVLLDGFKVTGGRSGLALGDQRLVEAVLLLGAPSPDLLAAPPSGTALELEDGGVLWRALVSNAHEADELAVWGAAVRAATP